MAADNTATPTSPPLLEIEMSIQAVTTEHEGSSNVPANQEVDNISKVSAAQAAEDDTKALAAQAAENNSQESNSASGEDAVDAPEATVQENNVSTNDATAEAANTAVDDSKINVTKLQELYTAVAELHNKRATVEDADDNVSENSTKAPSVCDDADDACSTTSGRRYPTRVTSPVARNNGATNMSVTWHFSSGCIHATSSGSQSPVLVLPPNTPAAWVTSGLTRITEPAFPVPPVPVTTTYYAPSISTAPALNDNPHVLLPPVTPLSVWHNDRRQAFLASYPTFEVYQARAARAAAAAAPAENEIPRPYPPAIDAIVRNAVSPMESDHSTVGQAFVASNTPSGSRGTSRPLPVPFARSHQPSSTSHSVWTSSTSSFPSTTPRPRVYTAADRFNATSSNTRTSVLRPRRHIALVNPKTTTPSLPAHKTKNKWFTDGDLCVISFDKELFRVSSGLVAAASTELKERIHQVAGSSDKVLEFNRTDDELASSNGVNNFLTLLTSPHAFDHSDKSVNTPTEFMTHHKTIEFLIKYKCIALKQQYCNLIYAWIAVRKIKHQYAFALVATMDNHKMSADIIARTPVQETDLTDSDAENMTVAPFFHPLDPGTMEPYVYDRIPTFYIYALGRAFNGKTLKTLKDKKILYADFLRCYFERLTYKEPSPHGLRDMASMSFQQRFRVMSEAGMLNL